MTYILKDRTPVLIADEGIEKWSEFINSDKRFVAQDNINGYLVSTVFLGVDHAFMDGKPVLFETMVFKEGDWGALECKRYCTWEEAEKGHKEIVEKWKSK